MGMAGVSMIMGGVRVGMRMGKRVWMGWDGGRCKLVSSMHGVDTIDPSVEVDIIHHGYVDGRGGSNIRVNIDARL